MPLSFMRDTATVIRAPKATRNGQEYFDWSKSTQHEIQRVQCTPQATTRDFGDRTLNVSDRRTFRAPYNADIQAGDRVVWNGEMYEVDGEVFHTKSPTGRISVTRCNLVRWYG